MKKLTNYTKGFTLIELLVVVAIIGILASVVLVSLNSARSKAKDARIISTVQQIRTQIESDSSGTDYKNAFTASGALITLGNTSSAATYTTLTTDALNSSASSNTSVAACAINQGGANPNGCNTPTIDKSAITVVTNGTVSGGAWTGPPTAYAIWGRLSTGNWFCIDSTGNTKNPSTKTTGISTDDWKCS